MAELTPHQLRELADGLANQNHESERIARIMGASMGMLEALKEAEPHVESAWLQAGDGFDHGASEALKSVRSAISKATGESQ